MTSKAFRNVAKLRALTDVTEYGAKGDGVTNDTAAIQAAAATITNDGALFFPEGHYIVNDNIILTNKTNVKVFGSGAKITQTGSNKSTLRFVSCVGVEVTGLHLVGKGTEFNGGSTSWNGVAGIYLPDCENVLIHQNNLTNHAGGGIRWVGTCKRFVITNNFVKGIGSSGGIASGDNGNDVAIGSFGGTTIDLVCNNNTVLDHAFGFRCIEGSNWTYQGNTISSIPGQHGFYLSTMNNVSIVGNTLEGIEYIGIKLQIIGNNLTFENFTITGNSIRDAGQTGIAFEDAATVNSNFKNAVVSSNSIFDCTTQSGIIAMKVSGLLITGNNIGDIGQYGIDVRSCTGVIANNLIENTDANGIILIAPVGDMFVQDNVIRNAVLNPNNTTGSDDFTYYFRAAIAASSCNVYLMKNTFQQTGTVPSEFASNGRIWRTGVNVNVYADNNTNLTTRTWEAETPANLKLMNFGFSRNIGFNPSAQASPSTPIYGFGRRNLYGTQSPQEAAMTDAFIEGDICWHADPENRYLGWVCTVQGTPGTWSIIGMQTTHSAASIASLAATVNTTDKFTGKLVWDTSNNRMMRASGPAAADAWNVIDGSAAVTPS